MPEVKTKPPLPEGPPPAPSIVVEGGPVKPPMKADTYMAPSIIVEGQPTKPPRP